LRREAPFLELAEGCGQNVSERIGARAGNQAPGPAISKPKESNSSESANSYPL